MNIPKIIHQSGKTKFENLPEEDRGRVDLLKKNHPDWEYKYWTDEDNYNLIADHYPWFLPCYNSYKWPIQRADAVRVFYMHKYGGVYLDLDMLSLQPMDELFGRVLENDCQYLYNPSSSRGVLLFEEYPNAFSIQNALYNAIMASEPGHAFWTLCFFLLQEFNKSRLRIDQVKESRVFSTTGPKFLHEAFKRYINSSEKPEVSVLPYFYTNPVCLPKKDSDNQLVLFNKFNIASLFSLSGGSHWTSPPSEYLNKALVPDSYFIHQSKRTWTADLN